MNDIVKVESNTPDVLLRLAIDKNLDTDKLRELMTLEREWRADQAKAAYAVAMTKFEGLKQTVQHNRHGKTAGNTSFGYADFPALTKAISPWLNQCDLSFSHHEDAPIFNEKGEVMYIMIHCTIRHISGHSETNHFPAMPDERLKGKVSPSQLIQMAITYAKRQTLAMGLGLATAEDRRDDDSTKPDPLVTEEQVANLKALIDEVGKDGELALLDWAKIDKIDQLLAKKYAPAVKALEKRRKEAK